MDSNSSSPDLRPEPYLHLILRCLGQTHTSLIVAPCMVSVLQSPVPAYILYLGSQRRWSPAPLAAPGLSDLLTFHSSVMQLTEILGIILCWGGRSVQLRLMVILGFLIWITNIAGRTYFQLLTCVDRYLAVVHPVAYRHLRQVRRVRAAYATVVCFWLLSVGLMAAGLQFTYQVSVVAVMSALSQCLIITAYCSISVLCVLKRQRPGEGGGARRKTDQWKQRAFNTIVAITVVMLLKLGGALTFNVVYTSAVDIDVCLTWTSAFWLDVPSSLVLPLLFLHREGKLGLCSAPPTQINTRCCNSRYRKDVRK